MKVRRLELANRVDGDNPEGFWVNVDVQLPELLNDAAIFGHWGETLSICTEVEQLSPREKL